MNRRSRSSKTAFRCICGTDLHRALFHLHFSFFKFTFPHFRQFTAIHRLIFALSRLSTASNISVVVSTTITALPVQPQLILLDVVLRLPQIAPNSPNNSFLRCLETLVPAQYCTHCYLLFFWHPSTDTASSAPFAHFTTCSQQTTPHFVFCRFPGSFLWVLFWVISTLTCTLYTLPVFHPAHPNPPILPASPLPSLIPIFV